MKVRITQDVPGGLGGTHPEPVVIELPDGAPVPEGGVTVADDTPAAKEGKKK